MIAFTTMDCTIVYAAMTIQNYQIIIYVNQVTHFIVRTDDWLMPIFLMPCDLPTPLLRSIDRS